MEIATLKLPKCGCKNICLMPRMCLRRLAQDRSDHQAAEEAWNEYEDEGGVSLEAMKAELGIE